MATKITNQARLKQSYRDTFQEELLKELELKNVNQVPILEKIVINVGLGRAKDDKKYLEVATTTLNKITGQKPVETLAKKSIATFKLREGNKIGLKVTLRGERMYEFLDRLISIALPRVRDFRGISRTAFDGRGNYTLGLAEQIIFPEIDMEKSAVRGMNVTVVTSAKTDKEAEALLEMLGFPFRKKSDAQSAAARGEQGAGAEASASM